MTDPVGIFIIGSEKPLGSAAAMKPEYGFWLGSRATKQQAIDFAREHLALGLGVIKVFHVTSAAPDVATVFEESSVIP